MRYLKHAKKCRECLGTLLSRCNNEQKIYTNSLVQKWKLTPYIYMYLLLYTYMIVLTSLHWQCPVPLVLGCPSNWLLDWLESCWTLLLLLLVLPLGLCRHIAPWQAWVLENVCMWWKRKRREGERDVIILWQSVHLESMNQVILTPTHNSVVVLVPLEHLACDGQILYIGDPLSFVWQQS